MKKSLIISIIAFITFPALVHAYADVHTTRSNVPAVDIYKYYASNESDAMRMHKNYVRALGLPDNVVDILDKVKVVSKPVAAATSGMTSGMSLAVQQGFSITVDVLKQANDMFGATLLNEAIGRAFRGDAHAFHPNVPRGNRGRFAEWNTDHIMYAIVTMPGSLVPLHAYAQREAPGDITIITVTVKNDPAEPTNKVYEASFGGTGQSEFLPAEQDKRDRAQIRSAAKESGVKAATLPGAPAL